MEREEDCWFVRMLPDGRPVVRLQGVERAVEIDGIEIPQPPADLYLEIFDQRLPRLRKPLRCVIRAVSPEGSIRAKLFCYGWHDKSGDVWVDLAHILLDDGLVRVAAVEFPEREEYLRHEQAGISRDKGKGRA